MGMICCVAKVQDDVKGNCNVNDIDHSKSLVNLPAELLVKILSYLSTRDKLIMRYVSRRFRHVMEMPLLWKIISLDYEPRHVYTVSELLKTWGEHVHQIFFPAHVKPTKILEMARCCKEVRCLSLPKDTQLSSDDLKELVHVMRRLQRLDLFLPECHNTIYPSPRVHVIRRPRRLDLFPPNTIYPSTRLSEFMKDLLKIISESVSVRELILRVDCNDFHDVLWSVLSPIELWGKEGNYLPPIINILMIIRPVTTIHWSYSISEHPSFEIHLYDGKRIPMNLYPSVPLRKFQYGLEATPLLIQLRDYGIVGLLKDVCFLTEYDHYGTVRHTLTSTAHNYVNRHFETRKLDLLQSYNCITHLHTVSYVDISDIDVHSNHLEQLAVACPNLLRLNLKRNFHCLKHLQGLCAIIHMCENLEGLNLVGISVSSVESHLLLWELLSSLKKLTHLAIDLCMLKQCGRGDANRQKLIKMFESCYNLQALEIQSYGSAGCKECSSNRDFLFSHFPSLRHCRMCNFQCSALAYAISNCHQLKYLYEMNTFWGIALDERLLPSSLLIKCHLRQLYINKLTFDPSNEFIEMLSAHGELECVVLHVSSISISGITTLINNSPNLILLHIFTNMRLFNENYGGFCIIDRLKQMFSYRKLIAVGSFYIGYNSMKKLEDKVTLDSDLNSLWPSHNIFL